VSVSVLQRVRLVFWRARQPASSVVAASIQEQQLVQQITNFITEHRLCILRISCRKEHFSDCLLGEVTKEELVKHWGFTEDDAAAFDREV
jgi:hypothetical protein